MIKVYSNFRQSSIYKIHVLNHARPINIRMTFKTNLVLVLLLLGGRRSWTESKERKLKKILQKVLSQEITQKSTLKSTKKRTLAGEYSEKYSKKYWKKCVKKHSRRTELKKVLQKVQEKILKKVLPSVSTLGRKVTLTEKCITNLEEAFIADKALEQIKRLSATTSL